MSDNIIIDPFKDMSGRFVKCAGCGKPIVERLPNGLWRFKFGKPRVTDINGHPEIQKGKAVFQNVQSPVFIYLHGSLRIKCFRRQCNHWNEFNYFPIDESFASVVRKQDHL